MIKRTHQESSIKSFLCHFAEITRIRQECTQKGLPLHGALMDRVEFDRCDDGGTLVRLTKRLSAGGGPAVVGA